MEEDVPEKLKTAAMVQLASGLVNVFVMTAIVWFGVGTVCGICTIWGGGFGGVCGLVGCLLIPIGIFEIVAGAMGLSNPKTAGQIMRFAAYAEMGSVLAGGIPSAIAGFLVNQWLNEPEVAAFIEG